MPIILAAPSRLHLSCSAFIRRAVLTEYVYRFYRITDTTPALCRVYIYAEMLLYILLLIISLVRR